MAGAITDSSSSFSPTKTPLEHPKIINTRRGSKDDDDVDEQSPLLAAAEEPDGNPRLSEDDWAMDDEQETKSSWYMFLLTLGGFGLQMGWSVEMSNGSVCLYT
jgi:solute carrier family 45 protein 1/2/4